MSTRRLVLIAFALSGAAALIYEVAWTRAISIILGSTTYALSTMLGTFMTGLAAGGIIGGKLADRSRFSPLVIFAAAEFGIGIFGFLTVSIIKFLPTLYFFLHQYLKLSPSLYFLGQFIACSIVMMIPTVLMGLTFPVVTKYLTASLDEIGLSVGKAYSYNTIGAIVGSYASGFILIPAIGIRFTTFVAAVLNIVAALSIFILAKQNRQGKCISVAILTALVFCTFAIFSSTSEGKINLFSFYTASRINSFAEYKEFSRLAGQNVLYQKDSREGTVALWRGTEDKLLRLRVGAKIEGTSVQDLENTLLLAYLPIAAHPSPQSFLTIGLGVGVTLGAARGILHNVSLVEINEAVIEAIGKFGPPGLLEGIDIKVDDARNYLLFTDRKFDIISSEPSYPTDQATGSLFTEEFYRIAATKLNRNGIFCQWLPYHKMSNDDVTIAVKTFLATFKYTSLWKVPVSNDLILIGSVDPLLTPTAEVIRKVADLAGDMKLTFVLSKSPDELTEIAKTAGHLPINTDDHPILEFNIVKAFLKRS